MGGLCRVIVLALSLSPLLLQVSGAPRRAHNSQHHRFEEDEWKIDSGAIANKLQGYTRDTTHEYITRQAYLIARSIARLSSAQASALLGVPSSEDKLFEALEKGALFNDMPSEDINSQCAEPTSSLPFLARYFSSSPTSTHESHKGCKQQWHAMCPLSTIDDAVTFTNENVQQLIISELRIWWDRAVGQLIKSYESRMSSLTKLEEDSRECALFNIGRMHHTIQDSYAPGHVVREDLPKGLNCGKVLYFQGYTVQEEDIHGSSDVKKNGFATSYDCALHASTLIFKKWFECAVEIQKQFAVGQASEIPPRCQFRGQKQTSRDAIDIKSVEYHVTQILGLAENVFVGGTKFNVGGAIAGGTIDWMANKEIKGFTRRTLSYGPGARLTKTVMTRNPTGKPFVPGTTVICAGGYKGVQLDSDKTWFVASANTTSFDQFRPDLLPEELA